MHYVRILVHTVMGRSSDDPRKRCGRARRQKEKGCGGRKSGTGGVMRRDGGAGWSRRTSGGSRRSRLP